MTSKEMTESGMSAKEIANQISKEDKERMEKTEKLAKELGITVDKAISLLKARQRAKEYRMKQQELQKKLTEAMKSDASYRRVFGS